MVLFLTGDEVNESRVASYRTMCFVRIAHQDGFIATCHWVKISSVVIVKSGAIEISVALVSAALKLEGNHRC